ncbi:hypothetical protein BLA29_013393, partial [Euroglyphus maynei]
PLTFESSDIIREIKETPIQQPLLPPIHEYPSLEDFEANDTENSSLFQMEPIRLRFTDESSHCSSNSDVGDGHIEKQHIETVSKISLINSSICNLDHLFGSETISFSCNNSDQKSIFHRKRRLIIRRDTDGSFIDEIVDDDIANDSLANTIIGSS